MKILPVTAAEADDQEFLYIDGRTAAAAAGGGGGSGGRRAADGGRRRRRAAAADGGGPAGGRRRRRRAADGPTHPHGEHGLHVHQALRGGIARQLLAAPGGFWCHEGWI